MYSATVVYAPRRRDVEAVNLSTRAAFRQREAWSSGVLPSRGGERAARPVSPSTSICTGEPNRSASGSSSSNMSSTCVDGSNIAAAGVADALLSSMVSPSDSRSAAAQGASVQLCHVCLAVPARRQPAQSPEQLLPHP
eukprot:7387705-Prymnesium_polylepis.1